MDELMIKGADKEIRITSVELVDIINEYRRVEGITSGKKDDEVTMLKHKSFMTKIRTELKVLESLGLSGGQNILLGSYTDKQNQERPCFSLNRDGMLQMLNSESVYVRYKTTEYINELENKLTQVSMIAAPTNFDSLIEKIDTQTNKLADYFRPTHKKKLDINKYIKKCLGTLATKERCESVKELLLTQLGCYEIYDEVPIDLLHSKETYEKIFEICKMISYNENEVQMMLNI